MGVRGFRQHPRLPPPEGFRTAIASRRLSAHILRGTLLVTEVCVIVYGYTLIGLIESHAVFAICPLLIAALSGPLLGENVGLMRWLAIVAGLVGVIITCAPAAGSFPPRRCSRSPRP